MKPDDVHSKLINALEHDEFDWQEKVRVNFKGRNPAESLELVLFICPACGKHGTMVSKGKTFWCEACGYKVEYNGIRKFVNPDNEVIHKNIRDWSRWQKDEFSNFIANSDDSTIIAEDLHLEFHTGFKNKKTVHFAFGSLQLTREKLTMRDEHGKTMMEFPVNELSGIESQNKERMEFYHESRLYNVRSLNRGLSVNKWLWAFEFLLPPG